MGGVKKYPYPKSVWTPTGGWWWSSGAKKTDKRYLVFYYALSLVTWATLFKISSDNEVRV